MAGLGMGKGAVVEWRSEDGGMDKQIHYSKLHRGAVVEWRSEDGGG